MFKKNLINLKTFLKIFYWMLCNENSFNFYNRKTILTHVFDSLVIKTSLLT